MAELLAERSQVPSAKSVSHTPESTRHPPPWVTLLWLITAVVAFHVGHSVFPLALLLFLYALIRSADARSRLVFYGSLVAGMLCYAPQLQFFAHIFGPAAIALWAILAIWIALFVAMARSLKRAHWRGNLIPPWLWTAALPFLWTGLEYFRSELNPLRFSWLSPGMAFGNSMLISTLGTYGTGFLLTAAAALIAILKGRKALTTAALLTALLGFLSFQPALPPYPRKPLHVAGVQLEGAAPQEFLIELDKALARHPDTDLFLLSEYALQGPPPATMKNWCLKNQKHLIVGGVWPLKGTDFADTAFVIDNHGEVVFYQGKCQPIQFFRDGVPAKEQRLWKSPWGNIGIAICYDLSYTRIIDELVSQGAENLVIPTMDLEEWGRPQHELHARIAPLRSAEYCIPILRIASSGISQIARADGTLAASAPFAEKAIVAAAVEPSRQARLPVDRWLAPFCVVVTGVLSLTLLVANIVKTFARFKSRRRGGMLLPSPASSL